MNKRRGQRWITLRRSRWLPRACGRSCWREPQVAAEMPGRSSRRRRSGPQSQSQRYEGVLQSFDAVGKWSEKRWIYERIGSHGAEQGGHPVHGASRGQRGRAAGGQPSRPCLRSVDVDAGARARPPHCAAGSFHAFFGTDFSFEDLEERDVDQYDYARCSAKKRSTARACWKIRVDPEARHRSSQYTHSRSSGSARTTTPAPASIRSSRMQVVRRLEYADISQHPGDLDRARDDDDRPAARHAHPPRPREDSIQRAAQGRGFHARRRCGANEKRS